MELAGLNINYLLAGETSCRKNEEVTGKICHDAERKEGRQEIQEGIQGFPGQSPGSLNLIRPALLPA
jgi:hypothetical protein